MTKKQTPTNLIYKAAGLPVQMGNQQGVCRTCGEKGVGLDFEKWVKPTFNDRNRLVPGDIVCHACLFCFSESNEQLAFLIGKEKPQKTRNYSHFVVRGQWIPLSKGDKEKMLELLRASPDVAIIALSGQKHLVFKGKVGWWQIEEDTVMPDLPRLERSLSLVSLFYGSFFSKTEIETGDYNTANILKYGVENWQRTEEKIKNERGNPYFNLAIFLAQKGEDNGNAREPLSVGGGTRVLSMERDSGQLQETIRAEYMDAIQRESDGLLDANKQPRKVHQLNLF